jgi:uncharacterized Tic20 family protein
MMDVSRNERNIAALAQSLGILAALPVWLRWRNRSTFVRAHAAQSIVFDGVTATALVIVAALAVGAAIVGFAAISTLQGGEDVVLQVLMLMVCAPGMALIGFLVVLITALVLRLRAAMAANQGRPFHYPLLNKKTSEVLETSEV